MYYYSRWLWGDIGCSYYGFWTLFLGFIQMYVPIMAILDNYFELSDPQYELCRNRRRKKMILFSVLCSLFWGAAPLFGWSQMDYEPTGLSCSIYENKPGFGYMLYMLINVTFYEVVPFFIVLYCIKMSAGKPKMFFKVRHHTTLLTHFWTPRLQKIKLKFGLIFSIGSISKNCVTLCFLICFTIIILNCIIILNLKKLIFDDGAKKWQ